MGRNIKFTTNELKSIIHKFYKDKKYNGKKLTYTLLANYARDVLGYSDIKYYHFQRNKEISSLIKEFNLSLDESEIKYTNDSSKFSSLDVKEFVNNNYGNKAKLIFCLQNLQDSLVKIYDYNVELELKKKDYELKIEKLTQQKQNLKDKNNGLLEQIKDLKNEIKVLKNIVDCQEEKKMIDALNSTGLVLVEGNMTGAKKESIKKLTDENGKDLDKLFNQFNNIF